LEINTLIEPGVILGAIYFAARWLKGDIGALKTDMLALEQRLSREHDTLHTKVNDLDVKCTERFDSIERQNRRRLRALIDADL